jgi:ribosomal protein L37AE/L43A
MTKVNCNNCGIEFDEIEEGKFEIYTCSDKCADDFAKGGCLPPILSDYYFNKKFTDRKN